MKEKKKFLNSVVAFVCALVVAVSVFSSTDYKANFTTFDNIDDYLEAVGLKSYFEEAGYVYNASYKYVLTCHNDHPTYPLRVALNVYSGSRVPSLYLESSGKIGGALYDSYSVYFKNDNFDSVGYEIYKGSRYLFANDYSSDFYSQPFWYSDFPVYTNYSMKTEYMPICSWYNARVDGGQLVYGQVYGQVYNSSLGYLQNVTSKRMNIYNDEDNYQSKYKFTFDTTSSTGIDLTSGDYVVRLYEQTSIYIDNIWQPFDTPKVHIGDFDASSGSLSFNISEALAKTDAETGEIDGYNFLTIALNNYVRADTYWLQIYNTSTGEYGGFVQMKNNPKLPGQFTTSTVHGAEDDMSGTNGTDTGGYVDKIVDTNIGTGTNYEDAELNADKGDLGDSGELVDQLDNMVSTVMAVPQIFAKLFSFLPDWCLNLFGASVGLAGVILVWKAARG